VVTGVRVPALEAPETPSHRSLGLRTERRIVDRLDELGDLFDMQVQLRMGQANVLRWTPDILPLLTDEDPLGVDDLVTHRLPLSRAPEAYRMFQRKDDGCVKVVLDPAA
jgi:threonine dehydrogenase-like Zn-dependent dehydrogenase